jgi:hypothetical protein
MSYPPFWEGGVSKKAIKVDFVEDATLWEVGCPSGGAPEVAIIWWLREVVAGRWASFWWAPPDGA